MGKEKYRVSDLHHFIDCNTMILTNEGVVYNILRPAAQVRCPPRPLCAGSPGRSRSVSRGCDPVWGQGPFQVHWLLGEFSPRGYRTEVLTFHLSTRPSPCPRGHPRLSACGHPTAGQFAPARPAGGYVIHLSGLSEEHHSNRSVPDRMTTFVLNSKPTD